MLELAEKRDFEVNDFKKNFAEVTKQEVETFKEKIMEEHKKYMEHGPGTTSVSLDEGFDLLASSKETIKRFTKIREEHVLAEKLFNLPISKFPELIAMEEANKKYDKIYSIFKDHQNNLKEFGLMQWSKLEASQLVSGADKFVNAVKKLGNKLPGAESLSPFIKLRETITGFRESLPLIEMLTNPAIQERHWKKIMEETGKEGGDFNLKSLNLNKVFELEL